MLFGTYLAFVASLIIAAAFDISSLPNGLFWVPIADNGSIDYPNAKKLNLTYSNKRSLESPFLHIPHTRAITDGLDQEGDESEEYNETSAVLPATSSSHCHRHLPHKHNRIVTGHAMMNLTHLPPAIANMMDWITMGAEGGWLRRGEVRMAKVNDVVVGACVYKKWRLLTCVHELNVAMRYADKECATGKVGCHTCMRHWYKDYFRFAAAEAPNQCECAWYYQS
ncbi:hypothetical protein GGR55DRAFT_624510 [Xylaria sp. FL0064]|nr:hypothetical protein GGR55DRAFT_624510 [Xylaria sp. FL0064]